MRISDWSSDVCSSDLCWAGLVVTVVNRYLPTFRSAILSGAGPDMSLPTIPLTAPITNWPPTSSWPMRLQAAACGLRHRSEEHTSELQSLMRISYAVFCLKKKKQSENIYDTNYIHVN